MNDNVKEGVKHRTKKNQIKSRTYKTKTRQLASRDRITYKINNYKVHEKDFNNEQNF